MRALLFAIVVSALVMTAVRANTPESEGQPPQASESPTQNVASTNADPTWRPSPEQRETIATLTRSYFAARDEGKASDAYSFLSPIQKQHIPYDVFRNTLEDFNSKAGPVQARRLRAVTWYKDTPQGRGLYVAVDYSSAFPNLALHCGYLVWQQQQDGAFLITREEANMIDRETMRKLNPADVMKIRAMFRC